MSIYSPIKEVSYADGTTFSLPPIAQSQNGWVYKPDVLRTEHDIKRGKNKTFDRSAGWSQAEQYFRDAIETHFVDRNWEMPLHYAGREESPSSIGSYQDSLSIAWDDPVWGWITTSIAVRDLNVTFRIDCTTVAKWFLERSTRNTHNGYQRSAFAYEFKLDNETEVQREVDSWCHDPWKGVMSTLGYEDTWQNVFAEPPAGILQQEFDSDRDDWYAAKGPKSTSGGNGKFLRTGVITKIFEKDHNWKQLTELFTALKFVGFDIKPSWTSEGDYSNRRLTGISVDVPGQGEIHEHSFHIHAHNPHVEVDCGFMDDEERWLDRKQREAVDEMKALERDLFTDNSSNSYEIQL